MYSYFNDKLPLNFKDYFTKNYNVHNYNTRFASNIHIDYQRTHYGKFSVKYRRANIWNSIPESLRNLKYYSLFKNYIKIYIQNNLD